MLGQDHFQEFGQEILQFSVTALFALMQVLFLCVACRDPGYRNKDEIQSLELRALPATFTNGYIAASYYEDEDFTNESNRPINKKIAKKFMDLMDHFDPSDLCDQC